MNVVRPSFDIPILLIDRFLAEEDAQLILQECIDLKPAYTTARIIDGPYTTKIDQSYRKNQVVYLDGNFGNTREESRIAGILRKKVWTEECRTLWHEGYSLFDTINYATWHELVVSRYGNRDFFKRHQDTLWDHLQCRLVTLVYYVTPMPRKFTGGSLTLWYRNECIKIEPMHNFAVLFPSFAYHEVEIVKTGDSWDEGRFSINYWMGFAG